jgi:hypothetical protein
MTMPSVVSRPQTIIAVNSSGGALARNRAVRIDTATDQAITTTTTVADQRMIGVTVEPIASAAKGRIQTSGVVLCLIQGTVTRGHYLRSSATAGALEDEGTLAAAGVGAPIGTCAIALQGGTTGTTILVVWFGVSPVATPVTPHRFEYNRTTDVAITKNVFTIVPFNNAIFDNTGGAFNAATGVFTPTRSGYYQINAVVHGKFAVGTYALGDFFLLSFGLSAGPAEVRRFQQYEVVAVPALDIHMQLSGSALEFLTAGTGYCMMVNPLCANNQSISATGNTPLNSFSAFLQSE